MSDLEQSIADWRRQMLAAGIKTPVPMDELEAHLREEIELQTKSGLAEQTAFEAAVQQIGRANMLKNEFEKVDEAKRSRERKQMQIVFFASLAVVSSFATACVVFKLGTFSEISPAQQMSGLAAVAVAVLSACIGQFGHGFFPVILNQRVRDAVCISSGVLMTIWWSVFSSSSCSALTSRKASWTWQLFGVLWRHSALWLVS